jgi:hypothetical protein
VVNGREIDTSADRVRNPTRSPTSHSEPDWRGGQDFQAYLRAAEPRDRTPAKTPSKVRKDEKEEREAGGDLSSLFGPATLSAHATKGEGDASGIAGLAATTQSVQTAEIAVPLPATGGVAADINALSAAMDNAWAAAADKGKALTVLVERAAVLGLDVKRGADGSLSLILAARPDATPEVTRALEALRRRLEARGLSLAELRLAIGDEGLDPKVPGTLE